MPRLQACTISSCPFRHWAWNIPPRSYRVTSAVFFISVLRMENFSWEPKVTVPSDLFSVPCLKNTSSYSRWWLNWFRRNGVQKSCWVGEALDASGGTMAGNVVHPLHSYSASKLPLPKSISTTAWMPSASFWAQALNSSTKPRPCWPWTLKKKRKGQCLMFFSDLSEGEIQIKAKLFVTDFFSLSTWKAVGQN